MNERSEERVQWIYSSQNNSELSERYDEWAKDYDKDLSEVFGWIAPKTASDYLAKYVEANSNVLDAGAGTGLVGLALAEHGFQNLTAMDLSEGMLKEARNKNVYKSFDQMTLGEHLDYETNSFDAVITVGVMTLGHAGPESFDELIRITKPQGYIVFTIRTDVYLENGFKEKQAEVESNKLWKLIEISDEFHPLPVGEPEVLHQVWVYKILS
ncbi:MAG: class I SAM-dependent methyltransferase [Chloroflexota bacterium]|jgi:predicted TPR repeat methyltransferase|nr:class I SAM-dependent methyltransferase [Chloroflexota bacterium]